MVDGGPVVHELPADTRALHCPVCGVRFVDMPRGDALTEDPDLVTCTPTDAA